MPPKTKKAPKPPARPSWSIWRHKGMGWVTLYLDGHLKPEYDWQTKVTTPAKYTREDFEEINPREFTITATLKFTGLSKYNSSMNFSFKCLETNQHYQMHPNEFNKVMSVVDFHAGAVKGVWRFEKHGSSIGICLVKEITDEEE